MTALEIHRSIESWKQLAAFNQKCAGYHKKQSSPEAAYYEEEARKFWAKAMDEERLLQEIGNGHAICENTIANWRGSYKKLAQTIRDAASNLEDESDDAMGEATKEIRAGNHEEGQWHAGVSRGKLEAAQMLRRTVY